MVGETQSAEVRTAGEVWKKRGREWVEVEVIARE
jgi:hypothetical protein